MLRRWIAAAVVVSACGSPTASQPAGTDNGTVDPPPKPVDTKLIAQGPPPSPSAPPPIRASGAVPPGAVDVAELPASTIERTRPASAAASSVAKIDNDRDKNPPSPKDRDPTTPKHLGSDAADAAGTENGAGIENGAAVAPQTGDSTADVDENLVHAETGAVTVIDHRHPWGKPLSEQITAQCAGTATWGIKVEAMVSPDGKTSERKVSAIREPDPIPAGEDPLACASKLLEEHEFPKSDAPWQLLLKLIMLPASMQ